MTIHRVKILATALFCFLIFASIFFYLYGLRPFSDTLIYVIAKINSDDLDKVEGKFLLDIDGIKVDFSKRTGCAVYQRIGGVRERISISLVGPRKELSFKSELAYGYYFISVDPEEFKVKKLKLTQ